MFKAALASSSSMWVTSVCASVSTIMFVFKSGLAACTVVVATGLAATYSCP